MYDGNIERPTVARSSSRWIRERFCCRVVPVVGGLERGSAVEWFQLWVD